MQELLDIPIADGVIALFARGVRVVIILIGAVVVSRLVRRVVLGVAKRAVDALESADESKTEERNKRIATLSGIAGKGVVIVVWGMATIMALREGGFDVMPLLAGAGVVGLAIGFGAQNVVRDVIGGIFLLVENQIRVGDVASINGTGGAVQEINLRTTVLRDFEGVVHVFPNGSITTLANRTRTFSNYAFDVSVAYKEDPDRVMEVLRAVGAELLEDPAWNDKILDPLEVLGLDKFADSAIVIKMRIKTDAGKQWAVGREMNRRIKKRFEVEGIEIPFPHRTLVLGDGSRTLSLSLDDTARTELRQIIREEILAAAQRPQ
ncbi:MAG: mechanosensitive ion channel family protein [Chloroflexi bacterium]|nr:mechanosensitive ion channel family protein [Chloroflexota bacterium]